MTCQAAEQAKIESTRLLRVRVALHSVEGGTNRAGGCDGDCDVNGGGDAKPGRGDD